VRALTGALQPAYWQALIVVSLLYFARFDPSFITLRAKLARPPGPLPAFPGSPGAAHAPQDVFTPPQGSSDSGCARVTLMCRGMRAARELGWCVRTSSWPAVRQRMNRLRCQHARPKRGRAWLPGGARRRRCRAPVCGPGHRPIGRGRARR